MSCSDDGAPISKQVKTIDILSSNSPLRKTGMDDLNSKASDEPWDEGEEIEISNQEIVPMDAPLTTRLILGQ